MPNQFIQSYSIHLKLAQIQFTNQLCLIIISLCIHVSMSRCHITISCDVALIQFFTINPVMVHPSFPCDSLIYDLHTIQCLLSVHTSMHFKCIMLNSHNVTLFYFKVFYCPIIIFMQELWIICILLVTEDLHLTCLLTSSSSFH